MINTVAHLMTKETYNEVVTPLLKSYKKFLNKNSSYFKVIHYGSILQLTLNEFIEKSLKRAKLNDFSLDKEYYEEQWVKGGRILEEPSKEVKAEYDSYINQFKTLFGDYFKFASLDDYKDNKRSVRHAISKNIYIDLILDEKVTFEKVEEVLTSLNIKPSKRFRELKYSLDYTSSKEYITLNKDLFDSAIKSLNPYTEKLGNNYVKWVESLLDEFLLSDYNDMEKCYTEKYSIEYYINVYHILRSLLDGKNKVENYSSKLEKFKNEYINNYICKFLDRLNNKFAKMNSIPTLEFNDIHFSGSNVIAQLFVKFDDKVFKVETDIISAGGYGTLQVLHTRYLFKVKELI